MGIKKKDPELLQSWILVGAAGLPIAAWACAAIQEQKIPQLHFPPPLFCTPNILYSTLAPASAKSIVAGLKPSLVVGIVLGNIAEF